MWSPQDQSECFPGITQPQIGGGRGFYGNKEINSYLPEAVFPGTGILSVVGKKEAKGYRETGGKERFGSGITGHEEIWILKFGA